jgi:REP element-mobilizing transposase RayT
LSNFVRSIWAHPAHAPDRAFRSYVFEWVNPPKNIPLQSLARSMRTPFFFSRKSTVNKLRIHITGDSGGGREQGQKRRILGDKKKFLKIYSSKTAGQCLYRGMRHLRILKQNVWYEIHTAVNNREPLFRLWQALALFRQVLNDTRERFVFEMTGLRLAGDRLTFYIRPADGLGLPDILKWMKQTFAVRYNRLTGRTGHIWGDRYWSVILEGEPPEEEEGETTEGEPSVRGRGGVRPRHGEMAIIAGFSPISPQLSTSPPP